MEVKFSSPRAKARGMGGDEPRAEARGVWDGFFGGVRFLAACARLNLAAAMEYRASFIAQCAGMFLNDAMLLVFWWMYFQRFPKLGGWQMGDVILLWAVVAT